MEITFLQCKDPFVGDGNRCTLDSDGDEIPDQPLSTCTVENTELSYCKKVDYTELQKNILAMLFTVYMFPGSFDIISALHNCDVSLQDVCPHIYNPGQDIKACTPGPSGKGAVCCGTVLV